MFSNDDRNKRTFSLNRATVAFDCMHYIPVGASAHSQRQAHNTAYKIIYNYIISAVFVPLILTFDLNIP